MEEIGKEKLISLLFSKDYEERFVAEYLQLKDRFDKLGNMLDKMKEDTLDFKPKCPFAILLEQRKYMEFYLKQLRIRARIENIDLNVYKYVANK